MPRHVSFAEALVRDHEWTSPESVTCGALVLAWVFRALEHEGGSHVAHVDCAERLQSDVSVRLSRKGSVPIYTYIYTYIYTHILIRMYAYKYVNIHA